MIQKRVGQLRDRYRSLYGDELSLDEISRYVNGLIIDRQRGELAVFDSLSTEDLIATQTALVGMVERDAAPLDTEEAEPKETRTSLLPLSESETPTPVPLAPLPQPKRRGRPVGWRKATKA